MKSWHIHFAWAIVTAVACAITWRAASRPDPEPVRVVAHVPEAVRLSSDAPAIPAAATDTVPVSAVIAAQATNPQSVSPVERMRALIKSSQNWEEFLKVTALLPDRATKLMLAKEALGSENGHAVAWATLLLKDLKGRESAELLEQVLKTHRGNDVRGSAADALGHIGDPESVGPLNEALQSKSRIVQIPSAVALRKLGFSAPTTALMTELAREFESPDGSIRRTSVEWMGELDARGALPLFVRALKDAHGDVRLAAVEALQLVDGLDYVGLLEPLQNDPNPDVANRVKGLLEDLKKDK